MKRLIFSVITLILCLSMLSGCAEIGGKLKDIVGNVTGGIFGDNPGENPGGDTTEPGGEGSNPDGDTNEDEKYPIITIAEALELCGEPGNLTTERYYIKGTIVTVDNPKYGAMTIEDETGSIYVYGTYSADGEIGYADMEEKPVKGDIVILHCTLQNYNGTKEVKNARLISFETPDAPPANEGDYNEMSIAEARNAAEGTKIKLDGVVASITYANGMNPMGVMLVDETQSIYVYDGDLAGRVKVGNTVTILGSKAYWILEKEAESAAKFGYKGCCQLEDVTLLSLDDSVKDFNKTWIPEATVKNIIETPVTENITTAIYKVNALIEKRDGQGFVNYYIFDLDGETGAYTYTQCNGADFAWLDEFDGKICTVYLTALNAKSSSTSCYFRFIPVAVVNENFEFDEENTAEHVVKYYGIPQFEASYSGNPAAELITSVSSALLGFENASLDYSSSDENVVFFNKAGGKVIFNCKDSGKATVTVTCTYGGKEYSESVVITVGENEAVESVTVEAAQNAAVGDTVTVRGIVGPSVVNKDAFYLFDESGMIAVLLKDVEMFGEIEVGQEIIITGTRECYKKAGKTHAGQTCIKDAEIVANYYGDHAYPESGFITGKTLADIAALDVNEDHTTEVYVVKATINIIKTDRYTSLKVGDNGTELRIYCSGASQYSFLEAFDGQEVTLEIAPCNWNDKTDYAGCILAVRTADGKIINELNFNK